MRSVDSGLPDDRTVRARVRDAAIELVAEEGIDALTARAVAARAGVSPASVINNFGSMEGLRQSCDEFVVALIRREKTAALATGASFDVVGALRGSHLGPLAGYLAAVLSQDSPAVAHLIDEMVRDAVTYLQSGVESGMIRPTDDPWGRAVILTLTGLGSLVLNRHLTRLLGVDLTSDTGPDALAAYVGPTYELWAGGLFTDEFGTRATSSMAAFGSGAARTTTTTPTATTDDPGAGPGGHNG